MRLDNCGGGVVKLGMKKFDVIIVGGGASGLVCANLLCKMHKVAIVEKVDRVGKKILATGNGRCNLTNLNMNSSYYNRDLSVYFKRFSLKENMQFFDDCGLLTYADNCGRVYPFSNAATSVLDVLRIEPEKRATIMLGQDVKSVTKKGDDFIVETSDETIVATYCVVATGGNTARDLLKQVHKSFVPCKRSLVSLKTQNNKGLNGVRVDNVTAKIVGTNICESGEILFKDNAISGILIFNLSAYLARKNDYNACISVDFMPKIECSDLVQMLVERQAKFENILTGIFHNAISKNLLEKAGCSGGCKTKEDAINLAKTIKDYRIKTFSPMDNNQVYSGGVSMDSVDENLMSKETNNLFFTGECLDVDGLCGGYNLQWASTSAMVVASAIKRGEKCFK